MIPRGSHAGAQRNYSSNWFLSFIVFSAVDEMGCRVTQKKKKKQFEMMRNSLIGQIIFEKPIHTQCAAAQRAVNQKFLWDSFNSLTLRPRVELFTSEWVESSRYGVVRESKQNKRIRIRIRSEWITNSDAALDAAKWNHRQFCAGTSLHHHRTEEKIIHNNHRDAAQNPK